MRPPTTAKTGTPVTHRLQSRPSSGTSGTWYLRALVTLVIAAALTPALLDCARSGDHAQPSASRATPLASTLTPASTPTASAGTYVPLASPATPAAGAAAAALSAAAAAHHLCTLINEHRWVQVQQLFVSPTVWPRSELTAIRSLHFVKARVWGTPASDRVELLVTLKATTTWRSPLTNGRNDIFLTFARRGTTGDWLLAAVRTSP